MLHTVVVLLFGLLSKHPFYYYNEAGMLYVNYACSRSFVRESPKLAQSSCNGLDWSLGQGMETFDLELSPALDHVDNQAKDLASVSNAWAEPSVCSPTDQGSEIVKIVGTSSRRPVLSRNVARPENCRATLS